MADFRLPFSPFFEKWVYEKNVKPPDFESLPAVPFIQDPLVAFQDGRPHAVTAAEWPQRRQEISDLVETWLLGHAPPPPGNVQAILESTTRDEGHDVWHVQLAFGPDRRARLGCTLYLPNGERPAPVVLCNSTYFFPWAKEPLGKGVAFCIYNAKDFNDESTAYQDLFGDYDWSSFRRRGWSASRAIDWLETLDFIDPSKICIMGHSRSAKQAMAGAAFDERISAIVASSPGSGGSTPYRYCDASTFGESLELLTGHFPDWVLPSSRYFSGRENRLPADMHFLYALIAPRPVLMCTGINDSVESTWAVEQVYKMVMPVYALLGQPENIALLYRPGKHETNKATHHAYCEFLLTATGIKGGSVTEKFPFTPYHVWDHAEWHAKHAPQLDVEGMPERTLSDLALADDGKRLTRTQWPERREEIRGQIRWLLGDGPEYQPLPVEFGVGESEEEAKLLGRDWSDVARTERCRFGMGINGNLYYPPTVSPDDGQKVPAIIWLGPFCTATGYTRSYRDPQFALGFSVLNDPQAYSKAYRAGRTLYRNVMDDESAADGFTTFAFDPIGTGARQEERREFYEHYPEWSLMGKMVLDARHAIDALGKRPEINSDHVYLVGYAMGGMTALLTAAIDERVAGVVSVAGFTPFRTDTDAAGTGGVRRYSHLFGWLPRLSEFVGAESKIPVDFDEIIACIAPRLAIVMAPKGDWHATHADIVDSVNAARQVYEMLDEGSRLKLLSPDDWNRFTTEMQIQVITWLNSYL